MYTFIVTRFRVHQLQHKQLIDGVGCMAMGGVVMGAWPGFTYLCKVVRALQGLIMPDNALQGLIKH